MTPLIDVEPDVYDAASKVFGQTVTRQLTDAAIGLERALRGTGGMAGNDPGGVKWAATYDEAASVAVGGMTDLTNSCYKLAAMLELTGFNHGRAESASDPSRLAPAPADTTKYSAPGTLSCDPKPPSASGGSGHPPHGWGLVQHLVGYVWPDGSQEKLHAAAHAWTAAAGALNGAAYSIPEALHAIRSQQSPEVEDAATVCQAMTDYIANVAVSCRTLSAACADLADHIDKAHKDIESELESLLEWTIAIEAGGALLGAFSFGIGDGAAQAVEGSRIAATASRVGNIISRLIDFATTVAGTIGNVVIKVGEVAQRLKPILGAQLTRATAAVVRRLPGIAKDAGAIKIGGIPQGLTAEQFTHAAEELRAGAGDVGEIVVQGSRAAGTAGPGSDIDFAVRVNPQRFDELIARRFGTPNPGSAKERTMMWAIETGKIHAGEAGLSGLRRSLESQLGIDVDLSIIRQGGPFDKPPFIGVP